MRRAIWNASVLFALFCTSASAQTPTGDERLDRVRSLMANNLRRLPNYTCIMTIDRSVSEVPARNKPPQLPQHFDMLRVEIAEVGGKELVGLPGSKLGDQSIEEISGKGLIATGDFANLAYAVFRTDVPKLRFIGEKKLNGRPALEYSYAIPKEVSLFELHEPNHRAIVPYHGSFWADPNSFELLRLDSQIDEVPREMRVLRAITAIEYQKSRIGASDFLLPSRVDRRVENRDGSLYRNISTFESCRQYGTESVLRFDADDKTPAAEPATPAAIVQLPPGVHLALQVESIIDRRKSASGDLITARLTTEARSGSIVIPAGSVVQGRIRSIESAGGGRYGLEIQFSEIHAGDAVFRFNGFIERIDKTKGVEYSGALVRPGLLLIEDRRFPLTGFTVYILTIAIN